MLSLDGLDISLATLSGHYDINPSVSVYGSYSNAKLDTFATVNAFTLGAAYNIDETYSAFADVTRATSPDFDEELTGFSVGVRVDFGSKPSFHQTTADRIGGAIGAGTAINF